MTWAAKEAEGRLTEIIHRAVTEGPQHIRHADEAVVLVAEADFEKLRPRPSFKEFLLNGPGLEGVDLERDASAMRSTDL